MGLTDRQSILVVSDPLAAVAAAVVADVVLETVAGHRNLGQ